MLSVEGLGKKYGSKWLFRSISFQIYPEDRLIITGRNGSGKSTLLKILAGFIEPTEGMIKRSSGNIQNVIGYSSLEMNLYPQLSAKEHLEIASKLRKIESNSEKLLDLVGLKNADNLETEKFSSGMKARLKLALAIAHHPKTLILDEPTVSLDQEGIQAFEDVLDYMQKSIIIIATNEQRDSQYATCQLNIDGKYSHSHS